MRIAARLIELQREGLVTRADNLGDKRAHTLSLTGAGRSKVPVLAALADKNDAEYFGVLPTEEREMLHRLLRILTDRRGLKTIPVD